LADPRRFRRAAAFRFPNRTNIEAVPFCGRRRPSSIERPAAIAGLSRPKSCYAAAIVAKKCRKAVTLRAMSTTRCGAKLCIPSKQWNCLTSVASTEDSACSRRSTRAEARECRRSQPADHPRRQREKSGCPGRRGQSRDKDSACCSRGRRRTGDCRSETARTRPARVSASPSTSTACPGRNPGWPPR